MVLLMGMKIDFFPWDREGDELNTKYMYVVHAEREMLFLIIGGNK